MIRTDNNCVRTKLSKPFIEARKKIAVVGLTPDWRTHSQSPFSFYVVFWTDNSFSAFNSLVLVSLKIK